MNVYTYRSEDREWRRERIHDEEQLEKGGICNK